MRVNQSLHSHTHVAGGSNVALVRQSHKYDVIGVEIVLLVIKMSV